MTQAVTKLLSSYHIGRDEELKLVIAAYLDELRAFDAAIVEAAVARFVRGEVDGHQGRFRPSVPELIGECRSRAEAMRLETQHWEKRFNAAHVNWPGYDEDSDEAARRAFFALPVEDRQQALVRGDDYRRWCEAKQRTICRYSTYCRERRWTALPARAVSQSGQELPARRRLAPPWGKLWSAQLLRLLCRPPQKPPREVTPRHEKAGLYRTMCEQIGAERARQLYARQGFGFDDNGGLIFPGDYEQRARTALWQQFGWPQANDMLVAARRGEPAMAMLELEPIAGTFRQVDTTSPMFAAWQAAFERRSWPAFPERLPGFVWLPAAPEASTASGAVEAALKTFQADLKTVGESEESGGDGAAA